MGHASLTSGVEIGTDLYLLAEATFGRQPFLIARRQVIEVCCTV